MESDATLLLSAGALIIGTLFGIVVQRSRFCMVAAVSNITLLRDFRQLHGYLAALLVALLGTTWLEQGGWVAVAESTYRSAQLDWLGAVCGGLMFGFGAVLAGGCVGRTVVGAAEGNGGSLVALIAFALSGMATLFGVLEPVRAALTESTALELPSGDSAIPLLLGVGAFSWGIVVTVSCVAVIIVTARHTLSRGMIMTGIAIGGLTVAGWWVTGYWAVDEFSLATPASLTFSGPMARTMLFLISGKTSTALPFGIALVAGVLLGAALSALITRTFHWRPPQARYLHRPLIGGVLMGVGAIWAGGCNIVNGLTGLSTGSSEALLATIMILTGVYFGVRWLLHAEHVPFDDEKSSPPIPQHIAAAGDSHDKSTTQPQHKSAA